MYALIGYGARTPGKRPGTRLARIEEHHIVTWYGLRWVAYPFSRATLTVYVTWETCPDDAAVRRVQRRLPVVPPA